MRFFGIFLIGFLVVFAGRPPSPALGQSRQPIVREVIVTGNQRIEEGTIRSYLLIQEGDRLDPKRIDRSLKSLYATGLFADVTIRRENDSLVISVVENPVINRIAFEGNRRIEDDVLKGETTLRPRVVFTRTKVQKDVKRILDIYRLNGRFAVTVDPKVIQLPQNRADLVFEINEGPLTEIRNIRFIGNRDKSDSDLRSIIQTKESVWYRFFTLDDTYDPDRLTLDREMLRRAYLADGYADFRVNSAIAELSPRRDAFFVTFSVDEGNRYKFGEVAVVSGLRNVDIDKLKSVIEIEPGDWYDVRAVDKAIEKLTDEIGTLGFAFVEVRPRVNRDREKRNITIKFEINEGPRVFVERININGNVRTIDKVIRRELRLVEGDAFNTSKMRRSRQRIQDLDFFQKVTVEKIPGSASDKTIIDVAVEEKSTGSLSIGAGYSTTSGPLADIGVRERNLLGRGQDLTLNATVAASKSQVNLGFTEPYFLDREVAAGFDIFHVRQDLQDTSSFDIRSTGLTLRTGYPIAENLRQSVRYNIKLSEIENVASNASTLIQAQEGRRLLSAVSQSIIFDKRDSRIKTTDGYFLRMTNDLAGLGGSVHFLRNSFNAGKYFPLAENVVLSATGRVGHIIGLGEDIDIQDRFFLGGDNLRGFATSGVGPRDKVTKDALGGEWIYNGTTQLTFPLGLPTEFQILGKLFADAGSVGSVNPTNANVVDSGNFRASVGTGISWISPFGPIGLDVGFPVLSDDLDEFENLRINLGTRF